MKMRKESRAIYPTYFNQLVPIVKLGGMKLLFHYHLLVLKKALGFKTFKIDSSNICTTNSTITEGNEYQYRAGSSLERVIVESVWFEHFFLHVSLYLIDENRSIKCDHTLLPIGYSGMWRLWDKDYYNIDKWKSNKQEIDCSALDNLPFIEIP